LCKLKFLIRDVAFAAVLEEANLPRNGAYPVEMVNVGIQHYVDKIARAKIKNDLLRNVLHLSAIRILKQYARADSVYRQLVLTRLATHWWNRNCVEEVVEELNAMTPKDVEEVEEEEVEIKKG
jgi:hypothetical protein